MTESDVKNKNLVLISYLKDLITGYKIKAEYSTNDNDVKVIVVTETSGEKIVFFNNDNPLFNYYDIQIFDDNIQNAKDTSVVIGNLIGQSVIVDYGKDQKWQLIFKQFANPRTIEYMDIRRVAYTMTLKCIVNRIA